MALSRTDKIQVMHFDVRNQQASAQIETTFVDSTDGSMAAVQSSVVVTGIFGAAQTNALGALILAQYAAQNPTKAVPGWGP
jgi:hypothetical protein